MLRILAYHRVAPGDDSRGLDPILVSATPDGFRAQMQHLRRRYHPVRLDEVIDAFAGRSSLRPRSVLVTFDDAYGDFLEYAWPILRVLDIPVTLFVPTAFPGHPWRSLWWDRMYRAVAATEAGGWERTTVSARGVAGATMTEMTAREARTLLRELSWDEAERTLDRIFPGHAAGDSDDPPTAPLLSWDQLRSLAADGVSFGAHTRFHVPLTRVDPDRARQEIRASLADLRRELGDLPSVLAYPYGMHDERTVRMAEEEGCVLAVTCDDGLNTPGRTHPLRLRRTNITRRTTPLLFPLRMLPWFAHVDRWRHRGERALLCGPAGPDRLRDADAESGRDAGRARFPLPTGRSSIETIGRTSPAEAGPTASGGTGMKRPVVKVIYIMGSGRSGSTLLDIVLGSHPRIESMGELTNLVRDCWVRGAYCACGVQGCDCEFWKEVRRHWTDRMEGDVAEYDDLKTAIERRGNVVRLAARRLTWPGLHRYREQSYALFRAISEVSGRPVVVDSSKVPARALALSGVPGIDLRIIHLVRDPRGVAYSRRKSFARDISAGVPAVIRPSPLWRSSLYWIRENLHAEWVCRCVEPSRSLRVRYEDFSEAPAAVLSRVGELAGEDLGGPAQALLEQQAPMTARHTISGNRVRMSGAIRLRPDTEWTERLPAATRRLLFLLNTPLMRRYRYRMG